MWSGLLLPSAEKFPEGRATPRHQRGSSLPPLSFSGSLRGWAVPHFRLGPHCPPSLSSQPAPRGLCCGQPLGVGPALGTSPVNVGRKGATRGLSGHGAGSRHSSGAVAWNERPALPGGAGTELRAEGQSRLRDSGLGWGWLALRPGPTPAVGCLESGSPRGWGRWGAVAGAAGGVGLASPHRVSAGQRSAHRSYSVLS